MKILTSFLLFLSLGVACFSDIRYVKAAAGLNLRTDPSIAGKVVEKLPFGAELEILAKDTRTVVVEGIEGTWTRVAYSGAMGWVFDYYLTTALQDFDWLKYQAFSEYEPYNTNIDNTTLFNGTFRILNKADNLYLVCCKYELP